MGKTGKHNVTASLSRKSYWNITETVGCQICLTILKEHLQLTTNPRRDVKLLESMLIQEGIVAASCSSKFMGLVTKDHRI